MREKVSWWEGRGCDPEERGNKEGNEGYGKGGDDREGVGGRRGGRVEGEELGKGIARLGRCLQMRGHSMLEKINMRISDKLYHIKLTSTRGRLVSTGGTITVVLI